MNKTRVDIDPVETQEWIEAFQSLVEYEGLPRARYVIQQLLEAAEKTGLDFGKGKSLGTAYCNTIPAVQQPEYPGDLACEKRIEAIIRWNAVAMVLRAKKEAGGVGGHLSSFASIATI